MWSSELKNVKFASTIIAPDGLQKYTSGAYPQEMNDIILFNLPLIVAPPPKSLREQFLLASCIHKACASTSYVDQFPMVSTSNSQIEERHTHYLWESSSLLSKITI